MDWNWLTDEAPKVVRIIRKIVAEVKSEVKATVTDALAIWRRMRDLLDRVLTQHPEARETVLRAFEEELEHAG